MSNRRKIRKQNDAAVSAITSAARCSDCPGRATKKWRHRRWEIDMHHLPTCPSLAGITRALDADAADTVARAAAAGGFGLRYQPDGPGGWVVSGAAGTVTARAARRS